MDEQKHYFCVFMPLPGATAEQFVDGSGWYMVAHCESAEKAAEVVRALCLSPNTHCPPIKVETRVKL